MSFKIGQINLIDASADNTFTAFNVMYTMDEAFKKQPPAKYGIACYAGKKKLSACKWDNHSILSAIYTGDDDSPQGYTNLVEMDGAGLENNQRGVNLLYNAANGDDDALQAANGAGSNGVHTIIAYSINEKDKAVKIVDARVVKLGTTSTIIDNQGTSFTTLGILGVNDINVIDNQTHDEIKKVGPSVSITNNEEGNTGVLITWELASVKAKHEAANTPGMKSVGQHKAMKERLLKFNGPTLLTNFAFDIKANAGKNTAVKVEVFNKDGTSLGVKSGIPDEVKKHYIVFANPVVTDEVTVKLLALDGSWSGYASIWSAEFNKPRITRF